jgi:uncharacterized membrane protein YgcG
MSGPGRRFHSAEVRPDAGPAPSDAEIAQAMVAARELEGLSARDSAGPTVGFEDRVMAAIAAEPAPRLLIRRGGSMRGMPLAFLVSVRDAWRIATGGGRPLAIRAQAIAFVLLVVLATGSLTTVVAVGAASLLASGPSPTPNLPTPTVSPVPSATPTMPSASPSPSVSPSPSNEETPEPTESLDPGRTAEPTEPTETHEPGETPEATGDDHGGGSGGSGPGDDGSSGSGSGGSGSDASDDHGGDDGDGDEDGGGDSSGPGGD